jgi:hypothetical protein
MSKGLQKNTGNKSQARSGSLPTFVKQSVPAIQNTWRQLELTKGLPNATIIYGGGAGALFAAALYLLAKKHWMDGLLTMLPATALLGLALHLLKHGQPKR